MIATLNELRKDAAVVGFFFIMFYLAMTAYFMIQQALYEQTHQPMYYQAHFAVETL